MCEYYNKVHEQLREREREMKVKRESNGFRPVVITLESKSEMVTMLELIQSRQFMTAKWIVDLEQALEREVHSE